jgi:hypothetical protein
MHIYTYGFLPLLFCPLVLPLRTLSTIFARHIYTCFLEWTGVTIRTEHGPIDRHEEVVLSPADVGDAQWNLANL